MQPPLLPASNSMMLLVGNFGKGSFGRVGIRLGAPLGREDVKNGRMSAPWVDSKTPVGPPTSANPTVRQLVYAALVTGIWAGLLSLLIYGIGRAAGLDFVVSGRAGIPLQPVAWLVVLVTPVVAALALALVGALLRGLPHAGRLVFWLGTMVAVLSLWAPIDQDPSVSWVSRGVLALMHVVTWVLVVPQIARIVGDSEPGRSVERDDAI